MEEWHNLNENSNDLPNEGEWIEGYHVFINCPYCGESIEVIEQDWYNEIEKCKCNKCGKTFRLKTNNFVGVI